MKATATKFHITWGKRALIIAAMDVLTVTLAYFLALWLRFEFQINAIPPEHVNGFAKLILPWCGVSLLVFAFFGLYNSIWAFASVDEFVRIIGAYLVLGVLEVALYTVCGISMPRSYYAIGLILSFCMTSAIRFSYRVLRQLHNTAHTVHTSKQQERVMVIGAGAAARQLLTELLSTEYLHVHVSCLIDDNPAKWGKRMQGIPIVGGRDQIIQAVNTYQIGRIIYAIPSSSAKTKKAILDICTKTGCKVQVVPGIYQLVNGEITVSHLREVEAQDLLGREPIRVNIDEIVNFISGKVVMVTGGGGSIGSELCRQIAKAKPKQLIVYDIYENNAYDLQQELKRTHPELDLVVLIGSVRNTNRNNYVLKRYRPDLLFHAAAHKHVPLMEDSPNEAIKNNVFGTYKMAKAAAENGVKKFVLISSDKAVNPTNIMGASKRLCEMVVQMMSRRSDTEFAIVRFGNVLGSNGSVIPLFKKQIAAGGPVTVTHPDIIRYFMTIPEAVSLVLQASYYAKGGEIFILDMGEAVKIDDMARNLIRLSGYEPDVDIQIVYTGLRPGEKLYEELLMAEEGMQSTANQLIHIGKPIEMDDALFSKQLEQLEKACKAEAIDTKQLVAKIVPTYHPQ